MIILKNVTVCGSSSNNALPILRNVSLHIGAKERIGILALPGAGKTTLARVLCGIEPPYQGFVTTTCRVGWPIGYAGFLHPNLTVSENLSIIARLNDQDPKHFTAQVGILADLSAKLGHFMQDITPTERAVLAYMCAMATPANLRIADDVLTVGSPEMRLKSNALVQKHMQHGGLIYLSRNPRQLRQYCTRFFALYQQRLIPCATPEIAHTLLSKERNFA